MDGRNGGLESAARALDRVGVHIAILQEIKFADAKYAGRNWAGYKIRTAAATSAHCGGVALLYKEGPRVQDLYRMENDRVVGKNVVSCEVVTGLRKKQRGWDETRYFIVGCYIPPSEKDGTTRRLVEKALDSRPKGSIPIVLGDLNADLEFPRNRQEVILAAGIEKHGLGCLTRDFRVRRKGRRRRRHERTRGRWTFRKRMTNAAGEQYWARSKPDYFLTREKDRRRFTRCRWVRPTGHNSDHRALITRMEAGRPEDMRRYRKKMETCPMT